MSDDSGDVQGLYTTTQLARMVGVPPSRVRSWVRYGLMRPVRVVRRLWFFDFGQIAKARALTELTKDGVTPRKIRKSLESLRQWVPDEEALLTHLEALESGGPLVVRTEEGDLAEASGQLRLDFVEREPEARVIAHAEPEPEAGPAVWFAKGILAEEAGELDEAASAYESAIALGGPDPEVVFNLGNVLYAAGRMSAAAARFREATSVDPHYVEAWNNLGNALAELGEVDAAVAAFEQALAIEPAYADAHFNLAETLAATGNEGQARMHWQAYLTLDPFSPWAQEVRQRLQ